jgi:hypothetical protein
LLVSRLTSSNRCKLEIEAVIGSSLTTSIAN